MTALQTAHEGSPSTNGALPPKFRDGDLLPERGKRAIEALKRQLELEGKAGTTELLVSVLVQERHDIVDFASHRTSSASD